MEKPINGVKPPRGVSIASLVFGIVSIFFFPIITGPAAIILGGIGISNEGKNGLAITGIITGIIGVVAWLFLILIAMT